MDRRELEPGAAATVTYVVRESDLASSLTLEPADAFPRVFATSRMVSVLELAASRVMRAILRPGELSVGIIVDVSHTAPTPIGRTVTCSVDLMEVEGRRLRFKVACRDDKGSIGEGFHERMVIDVERFLSRLAAAQ